MPKTIGEKLVALKKAQDLSIVLAENSIKKYMLKDAYEIYVLGPHKERLNELKSLNKPSEKQQEELAQLSAFLRKDEIKSIYGALDHIFDVAYGSIGRDILGLTATKLTSEQTAWLNRRCRDLQRDLSSMYKRIIFLALEYSEIQLEGMPRDIDKLAEDVKEKWYQNAINTLEESNPVARNIFTVLKNALESINTQIQDQLYIAPLAEVVVERKEEEEKSQPLLARTPAAMELYPVNVYVAPQTNPFLWAAGWSDAGQQRNNLWLYIGSNDYRSGVIDRQLIECCGQICCSDEGCCIPAENCCNSCGAASCNCPSISCPNCNLECCSCPSADCCSGCGQCDCRCNDDDGCVIKCCGVVLIGGAEVVTTATGAGDPNNSITPAASNSGNSTHPYQFNANAASSDETLANDLLPHSIYVSSTWAQATIAASFLALTLPKLVHSIAQPLYNLGHCYKSGRSVAQLAGSLGVGGGLALATYFPRVGGPHTAAATGIIGAIAGYETVKQIVRYRARKNNNGVSNPEKWTLTSTLLKRFEDSGYSPQRIVGLILSLKEVKQQGAIKTNNKMLGAFRLLRALGALIDCCKNEQEVTPDEIMAFLQRGNLRAISTFKRHYPQHSFFKGVLAQANRDVSRYIAPPGGAAVTANSPSSDVESLEDTSYAAPPREFMPPPAYNPNIR